MNPARPANTYLFKLTCLRCGFEANSQEAMRIHFTQLKCKPYEVHCQCCDLIYFRKSDMAGHLNRANVYSRLPLACEPPLGSDVALGPSFPVSAPPRPTIPLASAALGHAVRPPPSPAPSAYRSPPPRLSSPASSVSSPLSVRSPISPAFRICLASSVTSSPPAVYLITAPSSLSASVTPSALVAGSLDPLLSSAASVVLSPPHPPAPVSVPAVVSEGAFATLSQEAIDTLNEFFVSVSGVIAPDQLPAQADASPQLATPLPAVSSPPVFTVASSPSVTSVASSTLSSDLSTPPSRRPRDRARDRDRDRSHSGSRAPPRARG